MKDAPKRDKLWENLGSGSSSFCLWDRIGFVSVLHQKDHREAWRRRQGMQQEVQLKGSRWAEEIPQRWKQPNGEDRAEMKKEAKLLRCTLLNRSAWSTDRKYMRRYKGKCDVFFGIKHRLRKEEMEEQSNKEVKEGWRFAANAARITGETDRQ